MSTTFAISIARSMPFSGDIRPKKARYVPGLSLNVKWLRGIPL